MDNNRDRFSGSAASRESIHLRVAEDCESVPAVAESDPENSASPVVVEDAATNFGGLSAIATTRQQQEEPQIRESEEHVDHIMDVARHLHNAHVEPQRLFGASRPSARQRGIRNDNDESDLDQDGERNTFALSFPNGTGFLSHWLENEATQQWMSLHDNDNDSISAQSNDSLKYYHRKKKGSSSNHECTIPPNASSSKSV